MIFQTLTLLIVFIFLTWFSFYPLGYLFLGKKTEELEGHEVITLSFAISIVFFVLLSVFLSLIKVRFLMIFLIVGVNLFSIFKYKLKLLTPWKFFFKNPILLVLIFAGILVQGFISFPSGYLYKDGLLFWSSQAFDGFWHISLTEAIVKNIPPQMSTFSGTYLQNYHYLVDILMGEYNRIFGFFSSLDLYFRFFPVLFSFLMGLSVYSFMARWKNKIIGYWSVFFTYFVGSFGFVFTYITSGKIFGGETAFWVSQLNTVVANPPHASAIILLCTFLLSFLLFTKSKSKGWFFICVLVGSVIAGFKISGGVVLLAGMGAVSLFQIIRYKKFDYTILFLILLTTNLIIVRLVSKDATSYLIFQPWWFITTMLVEKLGLIDWILRIQTYQSIGRFTSYLRILEFEGTAFLIFIVGNLGIRIVGFPLIADKLLHFKKKILDSPLDTFLLPAGLVGFVVPMLFLQKGVVSNSIQFMQYTLLVTGFYGAIFTYYILKKIKPVFLKYLFALVLIVLSIPTVIGNFVEFYGSHPNAIIDNNEISALNYLKNNSKLGDIILTPPFDNGSKYDYKTSPLPIYAWSATGYVSSLTDRETYLSDEEMASQTGYDVNTRLDEENKFFSQKDFSFNLDFLKNNKIAYIYVPTPRKYSLQEEDNHLTTVFSNDEVNIYRVDN
ncbi:MAG TPA: hypothetical protein VMR19_03370 [Candidatus Saccharimonadales bacterium]|jgi:hypothetical protein|nr:hypothetical protein [Candidatus Saccharimonadales bacterium]